MTAFTDLRTQLAQKRADQSDAAGALALLREQLKATQRQIADVQRLDGGTGARSGELAILGKQAQALSSRIDAQRQGVADLSGGVANLLASLAGLADPTQQIEELSDAFPFLLFPVRLEVRFQSPTDGRVPSPQLWIRIYPDDCQVDSFEPLLTDTEVKNTRSFWVAMWQAGGVESQERGAWRTLVGGSGSGRAAYLIDQYKPSNAQPTKPNPQDIVLVIVPGITVTPAEQAAAFSYWTAVWRADGDKTKEATALAAMGAAVGNTRAQAIVAQFAPEPGGQDPPKPYTRQQVDVSCAVLNLTPPTTTKTSAWTQAPKVVASPDRFVATLFNGATQVKQVFGGPIRDGLATGPDPSLQPAQQIQTQGDDLALNDDLAWLADFEKAVSVGMGIKVDLTAAEATAGFDRLVVLGLRLSSDEVDGTKRLEDLIAHHYAGKHGFSLIPQGSPTNNTDSGGSAYTWVDDADSSYDAVFKGKEAYVVTDDPYLRRDGQWLAWAIGIHNDALKRIPNAGGSDQGEARAMNVALWPATLGYMLEEMMTPLFSTADIAATREFFARYVSGRGPVPPVRVGHQPYGILPVTAFSRYVSGRGPIITAGRARPAFLPANDYLNRLHGLLAKLDADWQSMVSGVSHVGQAGDPHQALLDVVALQSGSVEFYQRYAESFDQLYNKLVYQYGQLWGGVLAAWLRLQSQQLLTDLGADPNAQPPILEKFFWGDGTLLTGPLVDDAPLSETAPIRAYTPDRKNYIAWLSGASLDTIRNEDFGGNAAPIALLYLLLRHAMLLGQWDTGIQMLQNRSLVDPNVVRREPSFIHVQAAPAANQSKFQQLYAPQPALTGDPTTTLGEYILLPSVLSSAAEAAYLRQMIAALEFLANRPTARLERLLAEHVDCCSYRLDAWKTGIVATRLEEMRSGGKDAPLTGVYLGAFGWLENLRPKQAELAPVELDPELAAVFQRPNDAVLKHDPTNAGYIHAPSLNHAATAAILKNAYRVNATPANPDAFAINLSSQRVRQATTLLEGVRNGQTLSALLGYQFERGLHDSYNLAEVDKFIYPLRRAFPLVADNIKSTQSDGTVDITLLEASNVLDGVKLANHIQTTGAKTYPFGLPTGTAAGQLPSATAAEQAALNAQADDLQNLYDAVSDLVTAESVYQVVVGNFDRAAANTSAFSQGKHPPETHVVDTPRSGLSLTHRVALHLDAGASTTVSPSTVPMTPRAGAEPALNRWLAGRMPAPANVVVVATYSTPVLGAPKTVTLTLEDLKLQPLDLLYLVNLDLDQAMTELDDRIVQVIRYGADAHPDVAVTIEYTKLVPGKVTLFELAALVRSLRALLLKSRAIGPTDMAMPLESVSGDAVWDDAAFATRVSSAIAALTTQRNLIQALQADLASDLDTYAKKVTSAFLDTALFGLPQTGVGQTHADIRGIYDAVIAKVQAIVTRWTTKTNAYETLLATWPSLTSDDAKIAMLRDAERQVAARTTANPPDPNTYKTAVAATKSDFDTQLAAFKALLTYATTGVVDFVAAADAMTPRAAPHDAVGFDVSDQKTAIATLRATLVSRVTNVATDLSNRVADATAGVTAASGATSSQDRVQQLLTAARRVLGEEASLVPRFRLAPDRGLEFNNCVGASATLLTDLKANGRRFPVDDWLYGVARVRDQLAHWENVAVLSEAFGSSRADLTPVQLPFQSDDRWLALEFDPGTAQPNSRLLYTAAFSKPFDSTGDQCGLLIDEWPEAVPGTDIVSGVTFHFDRPNSQPPQTMLLAVPPALTGRWHWSDLMATLNETFDASKSRGVEPAQIDASKYAQFLPATLTAVTLYQITIAMNLAINNRIYDQLQG